MKDFFGKYRVLCQLLMLMQLVTVHLVDAHLCSDPGNFISALLTSLSTMVQIELPHINVLSKVDLIQQYGKLGRGIKMDV